MFGKLVESLYLKIFINIIVNKSTVTVHVETCSKKGIVSSVEERFEASYINEKMIDFIQSYTKESPYHYISVLDISSNQGVIPSCERSDFEIYHDVSESEVKCCSNWSFFTSQADLYELEKIYKDIGVDFIFSPFCVLSHFFKEKIKEHMAMFVLIQENFVALCIFENSKLLFGEFLDMQNSVESEDEFLLDSIEDDNDFDIDLDDSIDLEDVDVIDDIDELDDFGDIEDLDSVEDIDEFSDDIEEEFHQESEEEIEKHATVDGFNEDYQRFSLIQSSLKHFYKDPRYDSQFVEHVYIADGVGISPDLKRYLEEEMFLSVYVRQTDLGAELSTLAQEEVGV